MSTLVEGDNGLYIVEDIIAVKRVNQKFYFLVKWKNYDASDNTWEPIQSFQGSHDFEFQHKIKQLKRWYWDSGQPEKERLQREQQRLQELEQKRLKQQRKQNNSQQQKRRQQKLQQQPTQQRQRKKRFGRSGGKHKEGFGAASTAATSGRALEGSLRPSLRSVRSSFATSSSLSPNGGKELLRATESLRGEERLMAGSESAVASDSSYDEADPSCESRAQRERRERYRRRARERKANKNTVSRQPRVGFPPAHTAPSEPYISRELEELDLLRLRERQKQTGGKVRCLLPSSPAPPPPPIAALSSSSGSSETATLASLHRRKRRCECKRKQQLNRMLQQQQHAAADSGRKQMFVLPGSGSRETPSFGPARISNTVSICRGRSCSASGSKSRRSSLNSSRSRRSSIGSSSSMREGSENKELKSSPLQSWLEGEEDAPELLPAELGNQANGYLEFRGDWDPVARANLRCRMLRELQQRLQQQKLRLQQQSPQLHDQQGQHVQQQLKEQLQQQGLQQLAEVAALLQRQQQGSKTNLRRTVGASPMALQGTPKRVDDVEVVGLGMGEEADEADGEFKHRCTEHCYCRFG
ncbi:hypothetical protein Efla_003299 [Eimeria flavescens]